MLRNFGKFLMLNCFSLNERFRHLSGAAQFSVRQQQSIAGGLLIFFSEFKDNRMQETIDGM